MPPPSWVGEPRNPGTLPPYNQYHPNHEVDFRVPPPNIPSERLQGDSINKLEEDSGYGGKLYQDMDNKGLPEDFMAYLFNTHSTEQIPEATDVAESLVALQKSSTFLQ